MDWLDLRSGLVISVLVLGCGSAVDSADASSEEAGGSSGTDESSTGPIEEGPDCLPADATLALDVVVDLSGDSCVVVAPVDGQTVSFECEGEEGTVPGSITIAATPALAFDIPVGTEVRFEATFEQSEWEQAERTTFIVREVATGELLLAKIDAFGVAWTSELFPLSLEPIAEACTSQPDDSDCLSVERRMWNALHGDATATVGDGTRTQVGDYAIHLQRAQDGSFLGCVDLETDFFEGLIARTQ